MQLGCDASHCFHTVVHGMISLVLVLVLVLSSTRFHPMSRLVPRPTKRTRTTQGTYHDSLDATNADGNYDEIHVCEGKLKKMGANRLVEPLPVCVALEDSSDAWMNLKVWAVSDDTDLALDPRGGHLYDEAVERDVMDNHNSGSSSADGAQVARKRYTRSKVSVSPSTQVEQRNII